MRVTNGEWTKGGMEGTNPFLQRLILCIGVDDDQPDGQPDESELRTSHWSASGPLAIQLIILHA